MTVAWRVLVPLCLFGVMKEFRPSESFVTQYLVGPDKNFTKAQVNQDVYPVGTYSNLSLLILVLLLTDWARYKPVIILEGLSGVAAYCLIIWGHDIPTIQVAEFFYGLFMATEVAYFTYIYAMCDKKDFQKVSGTVRSGILFGRFVSGVISQVTVSLQILSYHQLNFLTLTGVFLSVLVSISLPPVKKSIYFHRKSDAEPESNAANIDCITSLPIQDQERNTHSANGLIPLERQGSQNLASHESCIVPAKKAATQNFSNAVKAMAQDFLFAYRNPRVLKWSLWWSLATCVYLQVTSYIQLLWQETAAKDEHLYNGVVDAVYTLIGSLCTWYIGRHKMNLARYTSAILTVFCLLQGSILLTCARVSSLWVQYALYILFKILYHSTMVLASSEVAMSLEDDLHALIFGFNMFIALGLQSIFTLLVAAKGGFKLGIQDQFVVYGGYCILLGIGFVLSVCIPAAFKLVKLGRPSLKKVHSPRVP